MILLAMPLTAVILILRMYLFKGRCTVRVRAMCKEINRKCMGDPYDPCGRAAHYYNATYLFEYLGHEYTGQNTVWATSAYGLNAGDVVEINIDPHDLPNGIYDRLADRRMSEYFLFAFLAFMGAVATIFGVNK